MGLQGSALAQLHQGDYQLMWDRNAKENTNSAIPACPIKRGEGGEGG